MKTWTVVVELKDYGNDASGSEYAKYATQSEVNTLVSNAMEELAPAYMSFQIFECTEAPYGPQGVVLKDAKP